MGEQTKRYSLDELAGSCPPAPEPEGVTVVERAVAKWLHDNFAREVGYWGWADALDDARELLAEVDRIQPTLRDLLAAAHRQGTTLKREPTNHRDRGYHVYEMALPGGGRLAAFKHTDSVGPWMVTVSKANVNYVEINGPSIEQLATVARLVGLDGGTP